MRNTNENPFSIVFGKEPRAEIERTQIIEEIMANFCAVEPSNQIVLFTGVRGSGKSAITSKLMKNFSEKKDWIVADLLVEGDMLSDLLGKLKAVQNAKTITKELNISLSVPGISVELDGRSKDENIKVELDKILKELTDKGKRLLMVVDDVASTKNMGILAHFFHSCLMKDYNVFLLMNGVYDNIEALQNERTLTFLQRAPKIKLQPLNLMSVARLYSEIFGFDDGTIIEMASLTGGFAYAVQLLGYLVYRENITSGAISLDRVIPAFDDMLADGVYEKLYSDLTEKHREIISAVAEKTDSAVQSSELIECLSWSKSQLSNYKKELIKKGIIKDKRGSFEFALPRFKEYVINQSKFL